MWRGASAAWAAVRRSAGPSLRRGLITAPEQEPPLFKKLLVANRGEIACRVMRTARRLGIPSVAVYSDADSAAVHTRFADEAVNIGPAPSTASYLNIPALIRAVQATGADAVHPGYGFLSENAAFASAVEEAGATFVGPPAAAVLAMGDKVESKRFAHAAGVNTIPGWVGVVEGADHAASVARDIGFPVMIKASAGGGGKGMRVAWDEKELGEGYALAVQEAASAFGDSRMLIEKFIETPRHIEIQVLGDRQGNIVALPERECSIQRRNQKVIEESPSPFVIPEMRAAMGEQAVALCRAVGYYSAGTCEFLVDRHRNFYFLEMNTRLQVEHPITEAVTGLDLVESMLRVAAGQPLGLTQDRALAINGWAMEARVYAEDPARGFLPSIGRLQRYREPSGRGVRVDSGVEEGSEISVHYDPLISKVVTHGADRTEALRLMAGALDTYIIRGVQHNAPLLRSVLDVSEFVAGHISTAFLPQHYPHPDSSAPAHLPLTARQAAELLALTAVAAVRRALRLRGQAALAGAEVLVLTLDGEQHAATVRPAAPGMVAPLTPRSAADAAAAPLAQALEVSLPGAVLQVAPTSWADAALFQAEVDGAGCSLQVLAAGARQYRVQYCGAQRVVCLDSPAAAALAAHMPPPRVEDTSKLVRSPMPGTLVSVAVGVGDEVAPGDEVAVVEAMKMRNCLRAEVAGRVAAVEAAAGSSIAADAVIVRFE